MWALVALLAIVTAAGAFVRKTDAWAVPAPPPPTEDQWRMQLPQLPPPAARCATSAYPRLVWQSTQCKSAPDIPQLPRVPDTPRTPHVVGNGTDLSAQAPSGTISMGIGSFDNVTGVTSESSPIGNTGTPVADAYTLQLNTEFFVSSACAGSPNPNCRGWEQFIFANDGTSGVAFIQYWLLQYNAPCPTGGGILWNQFSFTGGTDIYCYRNSPTAVAVPFQPITNLANLRLAGSATATGDSVTMFVGATAYTAAGDNAVHAAGAWTIAEFNVFGYGGNSDGGGMATFNAGASLSVRTRILYGGTEKPECVARGFTGETNNLGFTTTPPVASPPGPALLFVEDSTGTSTPNCDTMATAVGDTHLHTFAGTSYDFQATGDFLLAKADPEFTVQSRQVSSAPRWPDASFNSAVATQMGATRVAVCASEKDQLFVNGSPVYVGSGGAIFRDGVSIDRSGNTYTVVDENGNSITATINESTWINVDVGLGRWPTEVHGLLANPDNSPRLLQGGDGNVYEVPLSFEELYWKYGESWRVKADESLLNDCGKVTEESNPGRPFYAGDLDEKERAEARGICLQAGVKDSPTVLDACTLDVAVLGKTAAAVYVGADEPPVNGNPRQ
ncbi:VWD domain-containing protein [Catellatospora tritici]|uniref:VWD domain-containing protein n=1 Tax=Catellatospora tritici TaxID=2851566 RepID=UPI001C2DA396|nr:VWD domain-containing protein [Catellatospora tritici]MBV1853516.1 VWD domain-containing protein [Catellatospora tritici]